MVDVSNRTAGAKRGGRRALVTGATGLVGSHIVDRLLHAGWVVTALVRPSTDRSFLRSRGVREVEGDLTDPPSLEGVCAGTDVVFHTAAMLGEWGSRETFHLTNVVAVDRLVRDAARAGVGRFVHLSSVTVYGREVGRDVDEDSPLRPTGRPYVDSKVEGERRAMARGRELGLEVTVARPAIVYGARDRTFLPRVCDELRRNRVLLVGSGEHLANTVYAGTVAELCLRLADHPEAPFRTFNVVDPSLLTWRELLTAIALRIHCNPPQVQVPFAVAYAVGGFMEATARLMGSRRAPPLTRFLAGILGTEISYSTARAEHILGFKPSISVREGLSASVPAVSPT